MQKCDYVFRSTNVFTAETPLEVAELAFAVRDSRILEIEKPSEILFNFEPEHEVIDFGEKFVCPGFHDAHLHFFHTALLNSPYMFFCIGESEADLVAKTVEFAEGLPEDAWVVTQGWRYYRWSPAVYPSKRSIDDAFPNRPCVMYSGDGHTLWLNTCAMEKLDIINNVNYLGKPGIEVDENGDLTGVFHEAAAMELLPKCLRWLSDEQLVSAYENQMQNMAAIGITSICDMSLMPKEGCDFIRDDVYDALDEAGKLKLRVHMFPTLLDNQTRFFELQSKYSNNDYLYAPAFKQFFDGVSSEHTARLTQDYTNARFPGDRGELIVPIVQMRKLVLAASKNGVATRIHTIGDGAIHVALGIYEEAIATYGQPSSGRYTLEHLENLLAEDIGKLAELGVVASSQPCHITLDPGGPEKDLGEDRAKLMWPFKTFEESGITQAFGTDSPITGVEPMNVLYAAVTRKDPHTHEPDGGWHPEQCISIANALQNYTLGSAIAAGNEANIGTLEPGKFADFVVLDQNLLAIDPEEIQQTKVLATYLGGECVYNARK